MNMQIEALGELTQGYQDVAALHPVTPEYERSFDDTLTAWVGVHRRISQAMTGRRRGDNFRLPRPGLAELVTEAAQSDFMVEPAWTKGVCSAAEVYLGETLDLLHNERPAEVNGPPMTIMLDKTGEPMAIQKNVGEPTMYTFRAGDFPTASQTVWLPANAFFFPRWHGRAQHPPQEIFKGRYEEHAVQVESRKYWPTDVEFGRFSTDVFSPAVWQSMFDKRQNTLTARTPITPQQVEARVQAVLAAGDAKIV